MPPRLRERLRAAAVDPRAVGWLYLGVAAIASVHRGLLGPRHFGADPGWYTQWNNYRIFVRSFHHLVGGQDLYAAYPSEHWDLFKYSPSFALLVAPFAALPELAGLVVWNVASAALLLVALRRLPGLADRHRALLLWLLLADFLTSVQNFQTNIAVAALVVLAFALLEEDRPVAAALLLALAAHVKIYPLAAALLGLLFPGRARFLSALALGLAGIALLPLTVTSPGVLLAQYASWGRLLLSDQANLTGFSVMQIVRVWTGLDVPRAPLALAGAVLATLPALRLRSHASPLFRRLYLAQLLVFMVVFNHMAESNTFVIAMTGVGIWLFARPRGRAAAGLAGSVWLLTSMSPRFPAALGKLVIASGLKALPSVLVWGWMIRELFTLPPPGETSGAVDAQNVSPSVRPRTVGPAPGAR